MIVDAGLPLLSGVPSCAVVDLTLIAGIPRFEQALDAALDAIVVDRTEAALESQSTPPMSGSPQVSTASGSTHTES